MGEKDNQEKRGNEIGDVGGKDNQEKRGNEIGEVGGGGGGRETEMREGEERTQNSELYYSRIKILGSCLFLQSVPANIHASRLHIKQ